MPLCTVIGWTIHPTMWLRRAISVCLSAYLGGLLAHYLWRSLASDRGVASLETLDLRFALIFLFFTIPGVIIVASAYSGLSTRHSTGVAYTLAILSGGLTGGLIVWLPDQSLSAFAMGTHFGFVTASLWAAYNRYISTAF